MIKITYIVPINVFNSKIEDAYKTTILSIEENAIKDDRVIFVGKKENIEKALTFYKPNVTITTVESEESDYVKLISSAVFQCVTPYFSVLEIGDSYCSFWRTTMLRYLTPELSILLPINKFFEKNTFVCLGNEIAWSIGFANMAENGKGLGFLDVDCLKTYLDFNVTGGLIKTEDFITLGGLKPSLKIAAWYEFLLRIAFNEKNIFIVPKASYQHLIDFKEGYMECYKKEITKEYGTWLIKKAQEEYEFKEEREIKYEPSSDAKK